MEYDDGGSAFEMRKSLQEEIKRIENCSEEEPVDTAFRHGGFELVGHGAVTNSKCGKFASYYGCIRTELHARVTLDGEKVFGKKVYYRAAFHSCDNPRCPVCYRKGWAVREAKKITVRMFEAYKKYGRVEHMAASVPPCDYGLSYEELRTKTTKALFARGVLGGVLIFHAFRRDEERRGYWLWSPHFHVLGVIYGGYFCRGCKKVCANHPECDGFEGRTRKLRETDGFIVKVMEERQTIGGTAWYQLNHSSLKIGAKRFHVATWFGNCSYRKLKATVEKTKYVCPLCRHDCVKLQYYGSKRLSRDSCEKKEGFDELEENGRAVWVEDTRTSH